MVGSNPKFSLLWPGAPALDRGLFYRLCHPPRHALVKDAGKNAIVRGPRDAPGNRVGRRDLHLISDPRGPGIQRSAEDPGKCEHIVDLVGEVAPARSDHGSTRVLCPIRHDLGTGLAMAKTIASRFIDLTISSVTSPAVETPIKTSAPCMASAKLPARAGRFVSSAIINLYLFSYSPGRPRKIVPLVSQTMISFTRVQTSGL